MKKLNSLMSNVPVVLLAEKSLGGTFVYRGGIHARSASLTSILHLTVYARCTALLART